MHLRFSIHFCFFINFLILFVARTCTAGLYSNILFACFLNAFFRFFDFFLCEHYSLHFFADNRFCYTSFLVFFLPDIYTCCSEVFGSCRTSCENVSAYIFYSYVFVSALKPVTARSCHDFWQLTVLSVISHRSNVNALSWRTCCNVVDLWFSYFESLIYDSVKWGGLGGLKSLDDHVYIYIYKCVWLPVVKNVVNITASVLSIFFPTSNSWKYFRS